MTLDIDFAGHQDPAKFDPTARSGERAIYSEDELEDVWLEQTLAQIDAALESAATTLKPGPSPSLAQPANGRLVAAALAAREPVAVQPTAREVWASAKACATLRAPDGTDALPRPGLTITEPAASALNAPQPALPPLFIAERFAGPSVGLELGSQAPCLGRGAMIWITSAVLLGSLAGSLIGLFVAFGWLV